MMGTVTACGLYRDLGEVRVSRAQNVAEGKAERETGRSLDTYPGSQQTSIKKKVVCQICFL